MDGTQIDSGLVRELLCAVSWVTVINGRWKPRGFLSKEDLSYCARTLCAKRHCACSSSLAREQAEVGALFISTQGVSWIEISGAAGAHRGSSSQKDLFQ